MITVDYDITFTDCVPVSFIVDNLFPTPEHINAAFINELEAAACL